MKKCKNQNLAKIFIITVLFFLTSINSFAGFKIVNVNQAENGGYIRIICEFGTVIKLDSKVLGRTKKGDNGFFIENVSPGLHIVTTHQKGFAPEAWPVLISKGEITKIVTTESSPAAHNNEVYRRIKRSLTYTRSKKFLVERNEFLEKIRNKDTFELITKWSYYKEYDDQRQIDASIGDCKEYKHSLYNPPNNLKNSERIVIDKEVQDEDGRYHKLVVTRETDGYLYCVDESKSFLGLDVDLHYYIDMDVIYRVKFDNVVIAKVEYTYSTYDSRFDDIVKDLYEKSSNDTWSHTYNIYPIKITIKKGGFYKKLTYPAYIENQLQKFARISISTSPMF